MKYLALLSLFFFASCLSYDEETEQKFQENQAFMISYIEEIGLSNNPFWAPIPEKDLDKQRKKFIAVRSKEELRALIESKTNGIPRIENGTERSDSFFREIAGIKDLQQSYDILTGKYPDIIIK